MTTLHLLLISTLAAFLTTTAIVALCLHFYDNLNRKGPLVDPLKMRAYELKMRKLVKMKYSRQITVSDFNERLDALIKETLR